MDSMLELAQALAERHADAAAAALDDLTPSEVGALLSELPADRAANLLIYLRANHASACLEALPHPHAAACIRAMPPQAAAEILRRLDAKNQARMLVALPRARRVQIELVLRQPRQTVGAWMETRLATARPGTTIADAARRFAEDRYLHGLLFVVGPRRRPIGAVTAGALINAPPNMPIETLLQRGPPALRSNVTVAAAIGHPGWREHDILPVIDAQDRLVGVIPHASLRRALATAAKAQIKDAHSATLMDVANIWYLGMAEIMNATFARGSNKNHPDNSGGTS